MVLEEHSRQESFLHASHNFDKYKYKTTKNFNFRQGKIY